MSALRISRVVAGALCAAVAIGVAVASPASAGNSPAITRVALSPKSLSTSGGKVVFSATVSHANICRLLVSPSVGTSTATVPCTSGSFTRTLTIPANNSSAAITYSFTFRAHNQFGTSQTILKATQFPPAPAILSFAASPDHLGAAGGSDTVSARFNRASTCTFTSTPNVGLPTSSFACTSGTLSRTVTIPRNTGAARDITFTLTLKGAGGTTVAKLTLPQAAG